MRDINLIVVHCSATREGRDYSVDTIRKWHTDKGWRDIGYHYVIQLDGTINTGRPLNMTGAHVKGFNRNSIGICYIGGVESQRNSDGGWTPKDTRTMEQKESLLNLLLELKERFPNAVIRGHRDYSPKACPSFDASSEYEWISNCGN